MSNKVGNSYWSWGCHRDDGFGARASVAIQQQLSSLGTNLLVLMPGSSRSRGVSLEAGAVTRFTPADMASLKTDVADIRRVSGVISGSARVQSGNKNKSTRLQGVTYEYASMRASQPKIGRFFTDDEDKSRAKVAVIGMSVVRDLFMDESGQLLKNPIGEDLLINRVKFQIIGILPEKGASSFRDQDDIVYIPLNTAMKRVLGKEFLDSIEMEITSQEKMEIVQTEVSKEITRKHRLPEDKEESFQIRNMSEIQETMSETSKTMSVLLASIAAISLFVGGIGIMNIMLVSVTERTREIGLRKAIGAKKRDILSQFLIESLVISFTGGFFGIILGISASFLLSGIVGWTIAFDISSIAFAFLFSTLIGIIFGLWPAKKAANLNPIEALRYE